MSTAHGHRAFSEEMTLLAEKYAVGHVTLLQLELDLRERGAAAFMLFMSLPFMTPVALPGVSVVFGVVIAILALDIVKRRPASLPKSIAKRQIEGKTLQIVVKATTAILRKLEKLLHPRLPIFLEGTARKAAGLSMCASAVALALPIPPVVLFTNTIPAFSLICFSLGFLEDDGLFVLLGHAVAIFAWVYLYAWSEVIFHAFHYLWNRWS